MALLAVHLLDQRKCACVSDPSREPIIPDFFVVKANGFADIVEFKLPELEGAAIVGKMNREAFSEEVASYVAQTRFCKEYFDDSLNRNQREGRSRHRGLPSKANLGRGAAVPIRRQGWRSVASAFPELTILTYDDVLDSVSAHLYQNPRSKFG